uniref:Transcriptional regulator n=1 Tax=Schistosoma curassoni TaxID=6186 RepID=A0A183JLA8_9TREM
MQRNNETILNEFIEKSVTLPHFHLFLKMKMDNLAKVKSVFCHDLEIDQLYSLQLIQKNSLSSYFLINKLELCMV